MLAILAEDDSDAEVLMHLVRRRLNDDRMPIKKKGYGGCAALCRKGARDIRTWAAAGVARVIVCHDSDGKPVDEVRRNVIDRVIKPSGFPGVHCIVIPVEEIEAWMIADEAAINAVIPSFRFKGHDNPQSIASPKEWLRDQSRASNGKPLYSPATFNPAVAMRLDLDRVAKKCPSLREFMAWLDSLD